MSEPQTFAEYTDKEYHRQVDRVVVRIEELAERIKREGHSVRSSIAGADAKPNYARAAGRVVHEITSALANAPLDLLISSASDADLVSRRQEPDSTVKQP